VLLPDEIVQRRDVGVGRFGSLPAIRLNSASCSRSSCDVISATPRLSWLTISKMTSSRSSFACAPRAVSRFVRARRRATFRDQRVGSFPNAVVYEPVGAVQALDQLQANRLPQVRVDLFLRRPAHDASVVRSALLPRQARCCSASCVLAGRRPSFPP